MNLFKKSLLSPAVALLLYSSAMADDLTYSIEKQSLKDAIETISKKSNTPYIVNSSLLDGKTSNAIKDINGTKNALDKILENSGLEAVMEDGVIIIKKKVVVGSGTVLEEVSVNSGYSSNGSAEDGYLVENISGIGIWGSRSLQDTPYSMSIVSSELIQNSIVNDFNDIFKKMPTVQENEYWRTPTLRGFQTGYPILEGLKSFYSLAINTVETESVEILNGTSGFMYGSGNVGGAINYILKKSTNEPIKNITIGDYGGSDYYTHVDVGGKIDDDSKLGYRINALYEDGETAIENRSIENKLISATFDYKISDNADIVVNLMHQEKEETEKVSFSLNGVSRPTAFDTSKSYKPEKASNFEANRILTKLNWDINDIFTARIQYQYLKEERELYDSSNTILNDGTITNLARYYAPFDFIGHGIQTFLDANFDTKDISHKLTMGVTKSYGEKNTYQKRIYANTTTGHNLSDLENIEYPNVNNLGKRVKQFDNEDTSILIGDDIIFNEQWSALVGVNYAIVAQKNYNIEGKTTSDYEESAITPTLSLIYKPFQNFTAYVSYIEALEQGIIVGDTYTNAGESLDPLVSNQYEIGAKYNLNNDVLISSALFRIEKANQYSDDGTSTGNYVQDGLEVHQGIEITATGKATDNLTIITGVTLMDLSVEESNNPDLEGTEPLDAASKLAKIYAEYHIPTIEGLTAIGGANYTGKKYGDTLNTDVIPSYTIYDIGLRYLTKIDTYPTTFNFNISNITDKDYWVTSSKLGDPRNIAFSMKMEF